MPPSKSTREKFQADMTDVRHGTPNGYINLKCRCARCIEAGRSYSRLDKELTKRFFECPPELHGTFNGYCNYRCRCDPCLVAAREARARWKAARELKAVRARAARYDGSG